ncbi:MAG TPA: RNA polymerase sigma factor [Thermoanaerobaculia bacterium]|jgi:RNA polymerase sigma-70 factor (ECF subfamily)
MRSNPDAGKAPDAEVVDRIRGGETDLFEVLMRRYNQKLYRAARSVFPANPGEAEDVVQDAWVRAFAHLSQFEGRSSLPTWLVRITLHEAWARARKLRRSEPLRDAGAEDATERRKEFTVEHPSPAPDPETDAAGTEMRAILEAAVAALPETYRTVFVLRAVEDMSTEETAESLEITTDAVKTRLHRARGLLRKDLFARAGASQAALYPFAGARCDRIVSAVLSRVHAAEIPDPV